MIKYLLSIFVPALAVYFVISKPSNTHQESAGIEKVKKCTPEKKKDKTDLVPKSVNTESKAQKEIPKCKISPPPSFTRKAEVAQAEKISEK